MFFNLEINGADANEPPVYFVAFSGDSGNYENVTVPFFSSSSSPSSSSASRRSRTSSRKPITVSWESTTTRTMLLQRKKNLNRRCNRQKTDCQTSTLSSPSN